MSSLLEENKNRKAYVVSTNTGEIIDDLKKGDKIIRATSIESYKEVRNYNTDDCEKWDIKKFYKTNISEMQLISKELTQSEKAFLFSIASYVSFDDCHLCFDNGVDIGTEDLTDITGLSRSLVYQTIDSLISKDILYKGKNSKNRQYFVNPWLYCKGNRINKVLKTMFKNYKIRSKDNIEWKNLKGF